ncbi:MAG: hypothetical protein IJS32_01630 [Kiritimatiellae bacterium]|nr:hypothetical protein [Kiritimatiellia bacterium]
MTAASKILKKALVGSKLGTAGWDNVAANLRDRAFFSAKVEDARILHAARQMCAEVAEGKRSPSEFRRDMRALLARMGHPKGNGGLTDLYSQRRLDVLRETNVQQARGYAQHLEGTTEGALLAFPAQELLRLEDREHPRNWEARWQAAGGRFFDGGRMIALKGDPIWTKISRFGTPWPPFDFNSGMGVEDIDRDEAVELGLIAEDDPPPEVPDFGFNDDLEAVVDFGDNGSEWQELKASFGDLIRFVKGGDKAPNRVIWRGGEVCKNLFNGGNFNIELGESSPALLDKLGAVGGGRKLAEAIKGKPLSVDQTWRDAKRRDKVSTHLSHFFPDEKYPDNIPLTAGDVELLPSIWRNPDRVRKIDAEKFDAEVDGLDGSRYIIRIRITEAENLGNPSLWTFFRTRAPGKDVPRATSAPTSAGTESIPRVERQATPRGTTERTQA